MKPLQRVVHRFTAVVGRAAFVVLGSINGLLCCAVQQPHVPAVPADGRKQANDVVALRDPELALRCSASPWVLTWENDEGPFAPIAMNSRPPNWSRPTRYELEMRGGALVAIDKGEFAESGLYWLTEGNDTLQSIDVPLDTPVRRVFPTPYGIVGVAGLCHGSGPFVTTVVSLSPTEVPTTWNVSTIAQLQGCPAAVQLSPREDAVVIATANGEGLVATSESKTDVIAAWPAHLHPKELHITSDASGALTYYVSFERVAAILRQANASWFTLRECVAGK